jgi:hypothetical protein
VNTVIVTIQAGNSDDKLSQIRWSGMIKSINYAVNLWAKEVRFSGFSLPDAYWQNACWGGFFHEEALIQLRIDLFKIAEEFDQDSIALNVSNRTEFIG